MSKYTNQKIINKINVITTKLILDKIQLITKEVESYH